MILISVLVFLLCCCFAFVFEIEAPSPKFPFKLFETNVVHRQQAQISQASLLKKRQKKIKKRKSENKNLDAV